MKNLELKAERVRNGLTQMDVAKKLNISISMYNAKENGKMRFSGEEMSKLIDVLKLDYPRFSAIFLVERQPMG